FLFFFFFFFFSSRRRHTRFSRDWSSDVCSSDLLLILIGVVLFLSRRQTRIGQFGRVQIGVGLILLALELIFAAAQPLTESNGIKVLFAELTGDILLDALIGAL